MRVAIIFTLLSSIPSWAAVCPNEKVLTRAWIPLKVQKTVVGHVPAGKLLKVKNVNGQWRWVSFKNVSGWVDIYQTQVQQICDSLSENEDTDFITVQGRRMREVPAKFGSRVYTYQEDEMDARHSESGPQKMYRYKVFDAESGKEEWINTNLEPHSLDWDNKRE